MLVEQDPEEKINRAADEPQMATHMIKLFKELTHDFSLPETAPESEDYFLGDPMAGMLLSFRRLTD